LRALYPVCPHICHALWNSLNLGSNAKSREIINADWPTVDEAALIQTEIELMIQVNGKLRGSIKVPREADRATIEALAMANEHVQKFLTGTPKKVVVVPGKLINIVV